MDVQEAVRDGDVERLRELSLRPGGFGDARKVVWPYLLRATTVPSSRDPEKGATVEPAPIYGKGNEDEKIHIDEEPPHKDEHQVALDTARAFVLYPAVRDAEKERLKARLHQLILSVLRKRRKLSYFQGYHDVLSVLMLTLCPDDEPSQDEEDILFACSEKISLFWLRDAMGPGLEPLLGLLRLVRRLIRVADPAFAAIIERTTPLPYFALSNLLTLFSHDVPTLPLIQHIFDFLLCHPPIMTAYLAAAFILKRRDEVVDKVEEEGEEGAMFVLLGGLPPLTDAPIPDSESDDVKESNAADDEKADVPTPPSPAPINETSDPARPPISLISLFQYTNTLYTLFPPSTPDLKLTSTLGPLSVHYPLPRSSPLPSDDDAESYVLRPKEVVFEPPEDEDEEEDAFRRRGTGRGRRREVEMRTVVAVAVLGAGVLLAIYGAEGGFGRVDWREISRMVGGVVREAGERIAGL